MNNILNYYYGIVPEEVSEKDNYTLIKYKGNLFLFEEIHGSIEDTLKIIDILNKTPIKYHLLVLTKDNSYEITYLDKKYCLLKVRCDFNIKTSLLTFNNIYVNGISNWGDIWSKRIDYYESQVEELIKISSVKYALQYYIGITEIGIYYFNYLKDVYDNNMLSYTIGHKVMYVPNSILDYYNPLNMVIDIGIRDIAEYFKMSFFNEILTESELLHLIDNISLNDAMANYLFLRLLYPSYFFNVYDDYVVSKKGQEKLLFYIKKSKDYEILLSKVYDRLIYRNDIKIRVWFIKSQH